MNKKPRRQAALNVRIATPEDAPAIVDLSKRVYPDMPPYSVGAIIGQIANFQGGRTCVIGALILMRLTGSGGREETASIHSTILRRDRRSR